ncbi:MAG: NADH-quinone oxidoreductase subunit J [Candidatus Sedimenticola sp. (ex Thyasira tokunagai)]
MTFQLFIFYTFSAILLYAATMVITRRNPVHSALFLVLAFASSAGIWMLAEAEFLAIVLVLVYVGAVMVLFLFVVMMLDVDTATLRAGFIKYLPVGALVAFTMAVEMFMVVGPGNFGLDKAPAPVPQPATYNNTEELGSVLYTAYMYPFEIAAVILLVAIIAAIGLTMRKRPETKSQDPALQVKVTSADRLRVVKMDSEE